MRFEDDYDIDYTEGFDLETNQGTDHRGGGVPHAAPSSEDESVAQMSIDQIETLEKIDMPAVETVTVPTRRAKRKSPTVEQVLDDAPTTQPKRRGRKKKISASADESVERVCAETKAVVAKSTPISGVCGQDEDLLNREEKTRNQSEKGGIISNSEETPKKKRGRPRIPGAAERDRELSRRSLQVRGEIKDMKGKLAAAQATLTHINSKRYLREETSREETSALIKEQKSVVSKLITQAMQLANLGPIDLQDPEQVRERIQLFFTVMAETDTKPTVAGLSMALNNMGRFTLQKIARGQSGKGVYPDETLHLIASAYSVMEELWEGYMLHGQINPVNGIFLGKNHYGYQDRSEVVVSPGLPESQPNLEKLADKYALPVETVETVENDSEK